MEEELKKHHLADRFSFLLSSADCGFRKPHKRIFQAAVDRLKIAPEDIWFVGDKLEYDVKGAWNSGLYPVWFNWRNDPENPSCGCLQVKNWQQFTDIIEALYTG